MTKINICIPSYQRAGELKVFEWLPVSYRENIFIYVRKDEFDAYNSLYGDKCHIIPLSNVSHVGETRQAIIQHQDKNRIIMMDDDLTLNDTYLKLRPQWGIEVVCTSSKVTEQSFYDCLAYINNKMDTGFSHGTVSNNIHPRDAKLYYPAKTNRITPQCVFYDLSKIPKELFIYDKWRLSEDVAQWLTLVSNGYHAVAIQKWVVSEKDPKQGGCYAYRDHSLFTEYSNRLATTFPEFCKAIPARKSFYKKFNIDPNVHMVTTTRITVPRSLQKQID